RLLRQLLTEGLVLSAISAAAGLLVAGWCRNLLVLLIPARSAPLRLPGALDGRVFASIAAVCLLSTVLFALAPAIQAGRIDLTGALKAESTGVVGGRGRQWLRSGLVLAQVSLSFILLVGAVLVVRSLARIRTSSPGFSTEGELLTYVNPASAGYGAERARIFQDELLSRVLALPGVESAAYARIPPFSFRTLSSAPIGVDGYLA